MNRQYKAFISYSWSDKEWGAWLHRTLEIYRTPKQLVGAETPLGPAPTRLHPIFKDREEEAAGHGIGAAIEEAMGASEFLIVLCSPRSAKSKWVNREVAWFKTRKSKERILALVVDGEPGASLSQTATGEECFPATLLYKVDENLQPTQELEDVPLAADARKEGDGKRIAKLKLAAALLGVGLDDLVKRDDRRRAARRRWAMSGMAASMMVLSGLTVFAFQQRDAARVAQAEAEKALQNALDQYGQAEGLIEYMIGDLRHKLQQEVQLKVLSDIATRAQDYYDKQVTIRIDDDGLGRRARVLDLLSALEQDFGNNDKSLQLARASVAASSQLLSREPNNPQRLIDHAHGVQGLGNLAYHLGDLDEAEIRMQEAVRLTERLQKIDSENEEWRAEYGSALANLGIVQLQRRDIEKSSSNLNLALIYRREFASMSPGNRQAQWELGTLLFWLEEIELQRGNKEKAFEYRAQQNGIYQLVLKNNPDDEVFSNALIMNRMREAKHYLLLGEAEAAAKISRPLLKEVEKKLLSYPDRTDYMSHSANALLVLAETEFTLGNIENSLQVVSQARELAEKLLKMDSNRIDWSGVLMGNTSIQQLRAKAISSQNKSDCIKMLHDSLSESNRLQRLLSEHPKNHELSITTGNSLMLSGDWALLRDDERSAQVRWKNSTDVLNRAAGDAAPPKDLASQNLIAELDARREGGVDYVLKAVCGLPKETAPKSPGEPAERD